MKNRPGLEALIIIALTMVVAATAIGVASADVEGMPYSAAMAAIEEVYPLDADAEEKLAANGFVVLKDHERENISECYMEFFDESDVSVFVTTDALLHIFHVVHDDMLKEIEKEHLYNLTELLVQGIQEKSTGEYQNTSSDLTHVEEAARRNVVFATVACKLLNETYPVPEYG